MSTFAGKAYHPVNGYVEEIWEGFSWPCLFLGFFWYIYKGMWGWGVIAFILAIFTIGFSWLIFPFFANEQHANSLLKRGFLNEIQWDEIKQSENIYTSKAAENKRYQDERDIKSGKYQLYLTKKYSIQKNATLEKYVIGDDLFETLEDSLKFADNKERQKKEQEENEILKNAFLINFIAEDSNANHSGVRINDILMAYNGIQITKTQDILDAIAITSTSTKGANLTILRENEIIELPVDSGHLGINGNSVELAANIIEERIRKLKSN